MASTNIQTFPGKVGVSNTNPIHTLDIGSNVYIEDTADTKFRVYGNIHASGITVDGSITVIETDNLSVKDPVLLLASGSTGTSDTGIIMKRSDGDSNVAIFYDEGVGLKLGHTLSGGDDIHLSVDTANALATSVYGPVNVVNSELKVAYDADTTSYLGRAAVGYMGQSDQASFSHLDKNTSADFALKQAASGATHLNTPTGQHIRFSVNASEVGRFTGGGDFKVGANKLYVDTSASEVQMYSQDTGSTAGPDLLLMRNNPNNGSNGDYIGQVRYEGLSDSGTSRLYAKTTGKIKTATNGSESGIIETALRAGGSQMISVRHSGDLFHIKNGTDFQVGETANLYVDTSTSRVGIGTATPLQPLNVKGNGQNPVIYMTDGTNNRYASGMGTHNVTNVGQRLDFYTGDSGANDTSLSSSHIRMSIDANGNVGIGTNNPTHQLHIGPKDNNHIYLASSNNNYGWKIDTDDQSNGDVPFRIIKRAGGVDSTVFTIKNQDGNVGIGTNNPSYKLDVNGDIRYDTHLRSTSSTQRFWTSGSSTNWIQFMTSGTSTDHILDLQANNGNCVVSSRGSTPLLLNPSTGGNVGIGTTNPLSTLQVGDGVTNVTSGDASGSITVSGTGAIKSNSGRPGMYHRANVGLGLWSDWAMSFEVNGNSTEAMRIKENGNVGIGTATPHAKLHVVGSGGSVSNSSRVYFAYYDYTGTGSGRGELVTSTGGWSNMGIYSVSSMVTQNYFVSMAGSLGASDSRIKKNIVDADDAECLETLRLLKPKKYGYKDVIERGEEPVWGFIAQEVRETLPYATQLRQDILPNIYELANVSSSNVITFTNFNTADLESNATTLIRTKGIDGEDHDIHLAEVIDGHTIRVEEDLTEWIGSLDDTGNVVAGNQLFVYGQEVDDFVFLKKEAIWTVATSALQEVDRQLQAEKTKTATLETQVAALLARVTALENA